MELDTYHADGAPVDQMLYNPTTGESFTGYTQTCGNGTACFVTDDGRYELRDMTTEDRGVISPFEDMPSHYFPGSVVTWRTTGDYGYDLHDLETGEVTPLYACSVTDNTIALYAKNGSLRVYDTDTGKIITDTTVEPVENQQSVMMDSAGNGYVWLELRNNDNYETTDDHGMQIVGTATDQNGTPYYKVKNSWNTTGPYDGYWYFSRPFVAYKTTSVMVNKHALPKEIARKLGIK